MKWLSILLSATTAASAPMAATVIQTETPSVTQTISDTSTPIDIIQGFAEKQTLLEKQVAEHQQLVRNTHLMDQALAKLKATVGHTWYAYSGDTPAGWDCSGLVVWTYEQLGIIVKHRADLQAHEGQMVTNPLPGDIMVFSYDGGKTFYHSAIYLGDGQLVQALRPGTVTRIDPVNSDLFAGNTIRFIRVVDTDPTLP